MMTAYRKGGSMHRLARTMCLMAVLLPLSIPAEGRASEAGNSAERENLIAAAAWDEAFNPLHV